jgi:hypothetical protein
MAALHNLHNRIAAHPSFLTEVCSAPMNVAVFLNDATRCPQTIVEARKFPLALMISQYKITSSTDLLFQPPSQVPTLLLWRALYYVQAATRKSPMVTESARSL